MKQKTQLKTIARLKAMKKWKNDDKEGKIMKTKKKVNKTNKKLYER